jgi:hypothetical protein
LKRKITTPQNSAKASGKVTTAEARSAAAQRITAMTATKPTVTCRAATLPTAGSPLVRWSRKVAMSPDPPRDQ